MREHASLTTYLIGYILSIVLTLCAFGLTLIHLYATHEIISKQALIPSLLILAISQLLVQLFFFLHLGREGKPRWNAVFLLSTVSIVCIVVLGSLWIMYHLNYNMTPTDMNKQILLQEGIAK